MDWKTVGNYVLLVGFFVAMVTMFNQVNARIDSLQSEMNRRFDATQAEMSRRFDRADQRFDQVLEVLRLFEGRITRLEEKAGIAPGNTE